MKSEDISKWVSIFIAVIAVIVAFANSLVTYWSFQLNAENQRISLETHKLTAFTQKTALFSQFQNEYNSIASRFPEKLLEKNFTPIRGSSDYKALQDYWIFCYAEWYQTRKAGNSSYNDLWTEYYSGLIANALEIPSLKFVIQDMMKTYGLKQAGMREFYKEIRQLAVDSGSPLQ